MPFNALDQVFDPRLPLPGRNGKVYQVPEGDTELGLWCVRVFAIANAAANGEEIEGDPPQLRFTGSDQDALQERLFGAELLAELRADGLGRKTIEFMAQTVIFWHACGREVAETFWNAGGRPEDFLPAANRAARRKAAGTRSTSTAAASTTQSARSGSGTKSRKTSSSAPSAPLSPGN